MDKFLALQKQFVDEKAKYYDKKFKDCTVIDRHPSDVKGLLKNLIQVYQHLSKLVSNTPFVSRCLSW